MTAPPAIRVQGLKKQFGSIRAVDGMDLEVAAGAAFGFIGPNGAGKTTFIKLLLGIARPSSGSVEVLGASPDDKAVRARIGYLPERLNLPPALTPLSFLRSVGRIKGLKRDRLEEQVLRVLRLVGLAEEAWTRRTQGFSKGMRQRTGLAAALIGDPDLLVLDEPTDGIDPLGRAQIRRVIREASARGATVFLNSHLLHETERVCDHVAIVHQGRVVRAGPVRELTSENRFTVRLDGDAAALGRAEAHGFVSDPASSAAGDDAIGAAFTFESGEVADLSAALKAALDDGLHVLEVVPKMRDLESVLEEAVRPGRDAA